MVLPDTWKNEDITQCTWFPLDLSTIYSNSSLLVLLSTESYQITFSALSPFQKPFWTFYILVKALSQGIQSNKRIWKSFYSTLIREVETV